jgi:predicted nuclease of predicted toxin-antitoxin system
VVFFLDHCVSNSVMTSLGNAGHVVHRLRDHIPTDSPDPIVIATAQKLDAILVTLNGDFGDITTYPPAHFGGIVSLQVKNRPERIGAIVSQLVSYLVANPDREHYRGKLLQVEAHRIRIRT